MGLCLQDVYFSVLGEILFPSYSLPLRHSTHLPVANECVSMHLLLQEALPDLSLSVCGDFPHVPECSLS